MQSAEEKQGNLLLEVRGEQETAREARLKILLSC